MNKLFAYSHIGNSRENQEDNYFIGRGKFLSPADRDKMSEKRKCKVDTCISDQICCCVSDGMGGYSFGEEASLLTVSYIDENYDELLNRWNKSDRYIQNFVEKLNGYICEKASKEVELRDMGATLCGVLLEGNDGICFNVGDSRAYRVYSDRIEQITVDHTEGQRLLELGLLNEEELDSFPKRKAIYKYIGKPIDLIPDVYEIRGLKEGEYILLCTDGLSDVIAEEELFNMMSKKFISTEDKGKFLVEMAVERKISTGDNVTLIIIERGDRQ
jgi:protein phosphatase